LFMITLSLDSGVFYRFMMLFESVSTMAIASRFMMFFESVSTTTSSSFIILSQVLSSDRNVSGGHIHYP
jgi:hypothetical protein